MSHSVKFYGKTDMNNGYMLEKALSVLKHFNPTKTYDDINDILELYNVSKFISAKIFRQDFTEADKAFFSDTNSKTINKIIGKVFSNIDDSSIANYSGKLEREYEEDLLELFGKFNIHKKVSDEAFIKFVNANHIHLFDILSHDKLVYAYDQKIRELMLDNDQSIDFLINKYLRKSLRKPIFLPKSLSAEDKELIVKNYINSNRVHPSTLELIASLPVIGDFKISDEIRLLAKERHDLEIKKLFADSKGSGLKTEMSAGISEEQAEASRSSYENGKISISVSAKWIKNNLDYPTLLNNFIYIYNFVDKEHRIEFISKPNQISVLERVFTDTELKNIYLKSSLFDIFNNVAIVEMVSYCEYLKNNCNIQIEEVLQWFFDKYLEDEFGLKDFIVNMPSSGSTYLEKCRTICSEMESILKQYDVFAKSGKVNHNLIEISSKPIDFCSISSLIPNKYIYLNENNPSCKSAIYWLFSDQTMLTYLPKREFKDHYECLYELLLNENVNISEYQNYQRNSIEMLINEKILKKDDLGFLSLYDLLEATILFDLYKNGFASNKFLIEHTLGKALETLKTKDWIHAQSSLLAKPECDYFDFYLNKSQFVNGQDLRNTYLHGTQRKRGTDDDLHRVNYYRLLMFVVMIVIKINDELCYKDEHLEKDKQ